MCEAFYKESEALKICATRVSFLSLFSCNFDDQFEQKISQICNACWDTPIENAGL